MTPDRVDHGAAHAAAVHALSALLPCGVLVIDAVGALELATAGACALLGTADVDALRASWPRIAPALATRDGAGAHARERVIRWGAGALDVESHDLGEGGRRLVLLRRHGTLDDADALLIAASRARVQEHVVAGLLHDLNGPLNNVSLTLALLDATLARAAPEGLDATSLARCRRYADTLKAEAARLADWTRASGATIAFTIAADELQTIAALLAQAQRMLHHHATLHEVAIAAAPVDAALAAAAEPALLRVALLAVLYAAIELSEPGTVIAIAAHGEDDAVVLRFDVRAAQPLGDTARAFERMVVTPASPALELVAARRIVEAQQGSAALIARGEHDARVELRLPRKEGS